MKKFIIYICMLMLMCGLFAGCGVEESEITSKNDSSRFKVVETVGKSPHFRYKILVDTETNVMYLYTMEDSAQYKFGGLTVLLDETGAPMLWEEKK